MRYVLFALLASTLLFAAKKTTGSARGENQDLILNVTIHTDPETAKELLGECL